MNESQIARYSRQILLKVVGGVGQQRLLDAPVRVRGEGLGLTTAAAYLAAGGSPVVGELSGPGFPVATAHGLVTGTVAPAPFDHWPLGARVSFGAAATVFMRADGCADCFSATALELRPAPDDIEAGAMAALAWQRLVLGLAEPVGSSGVALVRCARHR